jgi:hypothetical protein
MASPYLAAPPWPVINSASECLFDTQHKSSLIHGLLRSSPSRHRPAAVLLQTIPELFFGSFDGFQGPRSSHVRYLRQGRNRTNRSVPSVRWLHGDTILRMSSTLRFRQPFCSTFRSHQNAKNQTGPSIKSSVGIQQTSCPLRSNTFRLLDLRPNFQTRIFLNASGSSPRRTPISLAGALSKLCS